MPEDEEEPEEQEPKEAPVAKTKAQIKPKIDFAQVKKKVQEMRQANNLSKQFQDKVTVRVN